MNFEQTLPLVGVIGKNFDGVINGEQVTSDAVELHCLQPFDMNDPSAKGQTVVRHKIPGYEEHIEKAMACVGKNIVVSFSMAAAKQAGGAPRLVVEGFKPAQAAPASKTA